MGLVTIRVMIQKDRILRAVFLAIDELNLQLPQEERLLKETGTVLLGESGSLDSLGVVSLIVLTEEKLQDEVGKPVSLEPEELLSEGGGQLSTIGHFVDYIAEKTRVGP